MVVRFGVQLCMRASKEQGDVWVKLVSYVLNRVAVEEDLQCLIVESGVYVLWKGACHQDMTTFSLHRLLENGAENLKTENKIRREDFYACEVEALVLFPRRWNNRCAWVHKTW